MGIGDIFSQKNKGEQKMTGSIGDYSLTAPYNYLKKVNPNTIGEHIMQLETNMGTHPNTPPDVPRSYIIPPANRNEKPRVVPYQVAYSGYAGITPLGLGQFHKSNFDRNAPVASSTKYGLPLVPGRDPNRTQELMKTLEGAKQLANEMFLAQKKDKHDWSPETLTNDYMENWVGKGNKKSYTKENRARVLKYFQSLQNG